jgi:GT2 family glycosyltransferase
VGQTYRQWELIVVDDGSGDHETGAILSRFAARDPRVSVMTLPENLGIALATQKGLDLATGDYVCFLDHDDTLTPDALLLAASQLAESPSIDFLYADEDKRYGSGRHGEPSFRPDRNLDLLYSYNFVSHPIAVRRERIDAVGGMRPGFDGSQDHDLALRLQDDGAVFGHLPEVVYHWTVSKGSAAGSSHAKPYAFEAGLRVVTDSVHRQGIEVSVRRGLVPGHYELLFPPPTPARVGIVVASNAPAGKILDRLRYLVESPAEGVEMEVVLVRTPVAPTDQPGDLLKWPARWSHLRGECVVYNGWPNMAAALNAGAAHLGLVDFLVFADEKTTVVEPGTLRQLLGNLNRNGVGVVGAVALDPDLQIISSGISIEDGAALAAQASEAWGSTGHHDLARRMREVSAVQTTVMVTRHGTFESIGGFSDRFPLKYFDVAYCLDVRSTLGLRVVVDPLYPVLWKGANRLEIRASEHEEIAFAAFLHHKAPPIDPFTGHNDPAAISDYEPNLGVARR